MKKVKFRMAMMCELSPELDSKLVSEMELSDEEAEDLEQFKNDNGEIVLMGGFDYEILSPLVYEN